MHDRPLVPSDVLDQSLVVETLSRIYEGIVSAEEIRRAVDAAWGQLAGVGDRDFLPVRVARRVRQSLGIDRALTAIP